MSPEMKKRKDRIEREKRMKTERKAFEKTAFNNHLRYMGEVSLVLSSFYLLIVVVGIFHKFFFS
ncbi:hypothetical protein QR674_10540 [Acinetobacter chinensis]|uniref:Uncharacterized protein n=1 Tax=Acinetobacter chinensis TaxID=2004650 RepID=A0ABU3WGB1_9GAMM|nr:hypothetical protein [Acinetobacter chinensis]MDV2469425.1 hypothetical protein [Acinetobacter chinensis]